MRPTRRNPSGWTILGAALAAGIVYSIVMRVLRPRTVTRTNSPTVIFRGPGFETQRLGSLPIDATVRTTGRRAMSADGTQWTEILVDDGVGSDVPAWVTSASLREEASK